MNQFYGSFAMFFSATLSLCEASHWGCSSALRFSLCVESFVALLATAFRVPAMQLRISHSGGILAHSRRMFANSVAAPVFPADSCGAKFAIQRQSPCFPPTTAAAIFSFVSTLTHSIIFQ
jgi:hypothetical protein